MSELFEIKINNIDYKNINESKINESITSRYESLSNLNYFDINPYVEALRSLDLDTITTLTTTSAIEDIATLFSSLTDANLQPLKTYKLILFSITENILYNDIDLTLIMNNLSIKSNIRTLFFKIMFLIAINQLITTINTYYTTLGVTPVPNTLTIYPILLNNASNSLNVKQDITYLTTLLSANEYYNGTSAIFNLTKITNFTTNHPLDPYEDYI